MNSKKYPMTYDEVVNRLLKIFVENDLENFKKFTKEEKEEFVDNIDYDFRESYIEECRNYDEGKPNIFDGNEVIYYIIGLNNECERYYNSKNVSSESTKKIDESKYPMTYKEFERVLGELFVKKAPEMYRTVSTERAKEGWQNFLKEQGPFYDTYKDYCEMYDNPSKRDVPQDEVFSRNIIGRKTYSMVQWVYF